MREFPLHQQRANHCQNPVSVILSESLGIVIRRDPNVTGSRVRPLFRANPHYVMNKVWSSWFHTFFPRLSWESADINLLMPRIYGIWIFYSCFGSAALWCTILYCIWSPTIIFLRLLLLYECDVRGNPRHSINKWFTNEDYRSVLERPRRRLIRLTCWSNTEAWDLTISEFFQGWWFVSSKWSPASFPISGFADASHKVWTVHPLSLYARKGI